MTRKEKLAAVPMLLGLLLTSSDQILSCAIGVAMMAIGALILNAPAKEKAARKPERHRKIYTSTVYHPGRKVSR